MLNPNNDRLDYGQILAPPDDYVIDCAVGTTYSLDLDALTGACLALGLSEETDSVLMNNPVCLLEALRSTGDKVALFCEGGQIHLPGTVSSLYVLLEKMVFPVVTAKKKGMAAYPSFHPKFWLIRYKRASSKEVLYRVVVLSRNLTFDRSWDVSFYMDGKAGKASEKNQPLCDFLQYLIRQLPSSENGNDKAKMIRTLIRELPNVVFQPGEKQFYDYEFIPNGVRNSAGGTYSILDMPLFSDTFHEVLVMSPFLSGGVVRSFNDRNRYSFIQNPQYMLITREMSLGRLKPEDVSHFRMFTMRDTVIDGETAISDDTANIKKQDIHAKVYMIRKYSDADLYLGSLNASHNAVYGNIEFMIRLKSKNRYLNLEKLTSSLFGSEKDGSDNPFQEVTLENAILDENEDIQSALDEVIKDINRSKPNAAVRAEEDSYSLNIHFGQCDTMGYRVIVRPLLTKRPAADFASDVLFPRLSITELSEFYSVSVSDGESTVSRVLVIPTAGLPEDREKAVITSVISDKDCFYRYVAFLLGDDSILSVLENDSASGDGIGSSNRQQYTVPALYEKMLQTAATNPGKFRGIEYLIKTISEDGVIPEDFKRLYDTFKKAVKLNG